MSVFIIISKAYYGKLFIETLMKAYNFMKTQNNLPQGKQVLKLFIFHPKVIGTLILKNIRLVQH